SIDRRRLSVDEGQHSAARGTRRSERHDCAGSRCGHHLLRPRRSLRRRSCDARPSASHYTLRWTGAVRRRVVDIRECPSGLQREMTPLFTDLPDLAGERFGSTVVAANDEFFAPKEALIKVAPPEWREGVYTERGKWMDGWETRRRRTPGFDWVIVRLG